MPANIQTYPEDVVPFSSLWSIENPQTSMYDNLVFNVIAIPLAAGVLFSAGIVLSPAMGAVLMSVSTIIVAVNARLLKIK